MGPLPSHDKRHICTPTLPTLPPALRSPQGRSLCLASAPQTRLSPQLSPAQLAATPSFICSAETPLSLIHPIKAAKNPYFVLCQGASRSLPLLIAFLMWKVSLGHPGRGGGRKCPSELLLPPLQAEVKLSEATLPSAGIPACAASSALPTLPLALRWCFSLGASHGLSPPPDCLPHVCPKSHPLLPSSFCSCPLLQRPVLTTPVSTSHRLIQSYVPKIFNSVLCIPRQVFLTQDPVMYLLLSISSPPFFLIKRKVQEGMRCDTSRS